MQDKIVIHGARAHNLKNIDVEIPTRQASCGDWVVRFGKSSLAFDTLYAEGTTSLCREFVSLRSSVLGEYGKPDVDSIDGPQSSYFH